MVKANSFDFTLLSKNELDKRFETIKQESTPEKSPKQIAEIIRKQTINRLIFGHVADFNSSLLLYRVTKSYDGFDRTQASCFSHPPKNSTKLGRANLKGYPVLYCAESQKTAVKEMKENLTIGDEFYISCWELSSESKIFMHSLMHNEKIIHEKGIRNYLAETLILQIDKMSTGIPDLPKNFNESISYLNQKFGDLFSLDGNDYYHLTSVYAHEILYRLDSIAQNKPVLMYPSQENNEGINFAFPPSLVRSKQIVPVSVIKVKYVHLNDEGDIQAELSEIGTVDGDIVKWNQIKYKVDNIKYDTLIVETYNGEKFFGRNASKIRLRNSFFSVSNICMDAIKKEISKHDNDNIVSDLMNISVVKHSDQMHFDFEHGREIKTTEGFHCIKSIDVDVEWSDGYIE